MSAMGINAAYMGAQADSFVSVTVAQTSVLQTSISFSNVIADKLNGQLNIANSSVAKLAAPAKQVKGFETKPLNTDKTDETKVTKEDGTVKQTEQAQKDVQDGTGYGNGQLKTERDPDIQKSTAGAVQKTAKGFDADELDEVDKTILEALASILQSFSEILGISVEELEENITGIEASFTQITSTSVIASLVSGSTGNVDTSSILYSDDLFNRFKMLMDKTEEILDSFSLTSEQFTDGLSKLDIDSLIEELEKDNGSDSILEKLEKLIAPEKETRVEQKKKNVEPLEQKNEKVDKNSVKEYIKTESTEQKNESEQSLDTNDGQFFGREKRQSSESTTIRFEQTNEEFIAGLNNAIKGAPVEETLKEMGVTVREIVDQIVEAVKVQASPDNTSLEVSLTPENLGKVKMDISSKGGVVTAQITTDNQTAKAAIEGQLQILKEAIEAKGITVEAIEVTVSSFSFKDSGSSESNNNSEDGNSKKHKNGLSNLGTATTETPVRDGTMNENEVLNAKGSTVSFVA